MGAAGMLRNTLSNLNSKDSAVVSGGFIGKKGLPLIMERLQKADSWHCTVKLDRISKFIVLKPGVVNGKN